ncbi:hypothetical protein [Microvirga sp. Mcv34]|uniref:hypothetical protein n=1 Tax=Microvirga sp. Mcv34 TaxID=2926016 RepID=UPI0021CA5754|nr:hypothetical protein [Microvirga sp. Mcv34]
MMQIAAFFLVLIIAVTGSSPASAHRPYFTQVEKIQLPSGEMGEARLLNGDGILGPDPVRVIIVDAHGRLLARSHKTRSMVLSCWEVRRCLIFDFSAGKILDPTPSSFRSGPIVPGLSDHERDGLWELENGLENWGFSRRDPSFREKLLGYQAMLSDKIPEVVFSVVIGALCALLGAGVIVIKRQPRRRYFETFMAALAIFLILGMGLFLILVSGFFGLLGGLTLAPWLISVCLGGGLVFGGTLIRKWIRTQTSFQ